MTSQVGAIDEGGPPKGGKGKLRAPRPLRTRFCCERSWQVRPYLARSLAAVQPGGGVRDMEGFSPAAV